MLSYPDNVESLSDYTEDEPTARVGHTEMNSVKGREWETTVARTR